MSWARFADEEAVDAHTGEVLATYANPTGYGEETCAVIWEVYRRNGKWKLKAVDQGVGRWRAGVREGVRSRHSLTRKSGAALGRLR